MANLNETSRILVAVLTEAGDEIVRILDRATNLLGRVFRHRVDERPEYVGRHRLEVVLPQVRVVAQW